MFATRRRVDGAAGVIGVAFTDRRGGVSAPPFDSLHLGGPDGPRNRRLVASALGLVGAHGADGAAGADPVVVMRQVHGRDVEVVDSALRDPLADPPTCDALVTRRRDI